MTFDHRKTFKNVRLPTILAKASKLVREEGRIRPDAACFTIFRQLNEARGEARELKIRISRILELLTRQIAVQEKQFLELTRTVGDLAEEKSRLRNALAEKQTETDVLEGEFQRTKELLVKATMSERCKDAARMAHQACQTEELETAT